MDAGVDAFRDGRYIEAIELFDQALITDPDNLTLLDCKAAACDRSHQRNLALDVAKLMIAQAPTSVKGYKRACKTLLAAGRHARARGVLDSARRNCPRSTSQLAGLEAQLDRIEADLLQQQAHPPASSLSADLLLHIIRLSRYSDPSLALRLTHVCAAWRVNIIATPSAWRTLRLGRLKNLSKARAWLHRAGARLDRLVITHGQSAHLVGELVALMLPVMPDLQELELTDISSSSVEAWRNQCHELSHLTMSGVGSISRVDAGFLSAKSRGLRSLVVNDAVLTCSRGGCLLQDRQMQRLQSLKLNQVSCNCGDLNVQHLLCRMPRLQRLESHRVALRRETIPSLAAPGEIENNIDPLQVPFLESLSYSNCTVGTTSRASPEVSFPFEKLILPALKQLRLTRVPQESLGSVSGTTPATWTQFLSSLEVLDLSYCGNLSLPLLQAVLSQSGSLRFLNLSGTPFGVEVLEWLAQVQGSTRGPVPKLTALSLVSCDLSGGPIVRLVQSRVSHGTDGLASASRKRRRSAGAFGRPKLASDAVIPSEKAATALVTCAPLQWLCLDGNPRIDAEVVTWLRSTLQFVSCNLSNVNAQRTAGQGRWKWDAYSA